MNGLIRSHINVLRSAIESGQVTKDSPYIREQIDHVIDEFCQINSLQGLEGYAEAMIKKIFSDILHITL